MRQYGLLIILVVGFWSCKTHDRHLERSSATEQQQLAFDSVFSDVNGISACELHSLMVIQDGKVLYEKYGMGHNASELHICWSATKTFTATAVGFALYDGLLDLDEPIVHYFDESELPDTISPYLAQVTLHHLLMMASGWTPNDQTDRFRRGDKECNAIHEMLNNDFTYQPGTRWQYSNMDSYMAGVVVSKVTGMSLEDYLNTKLFQPLGITDYAYEKCPQGYNTAGYGLYLSTESLAKMGVFMLQKGLWNGKQLLPEEWFDRAMAIQIYQSPDGPQPTDWRSGYCYQMWACHIPGATRIDGMWGQYVVIMPDKNAVGVMTTLCTDREAQMNSFWRHVYANI